ncbi:hypothetical protein [Clostridium sp.]|uniref:hypothetical protein n=1 Tax=Clostridium sp. TaxID=1506 RepID=UPI001EC4C7A9|nr:hypothetical protein [Clostridium sp.]MBS5884531.1 hypothetical protein [Clostridium sp.]
MKFINFLVAQILISNADFLINNFDNFLSKKILNIFSDRIMALIGIVVIYIVIERIINNSIIKYIINYKLFKELNKISYYINLIHQPIMLVFLKIIGVTS